MGGTGLPSPPGAPTALLNRLKISLQTSKYRWLLKDLQIEKHTYETFYLDYPNSSKIWKYWIRKDSFQSETSNKVYKKVKHLVSWRLVRFVEVNILFDIINKQEIYLNIQRNANEILPSVNITFVFETFYLNICRFHWNIEKLSQV